MEPIALARRLAELGQKKEAQKAYMVAISQGNLSPMEQLESASYLFFSKGNAQAAFTVFVRLYNEGHYQSELMDILRQGFYQPNEKSLRDRYARNCRALNRYPYCFRKDFLPFEDLPILFFPYDKKGYIPYLPDQNRFGDYVNFNDTIVNRYFFKDLENPVLAEDVFSQYQLEYLNDNVRKSEWVGRENHIYLYYSDWSTFCSYLQCLDFRELLKEQKLVFLFEDEKEQYPIDFKARFGIDYSQYGIKPIGVREVNKLIWHTQLATHNGGDFFNEILFGHSNLLALDSVMMSSVEQTIRDTRRAWRKDRSQFVHSPIYPLLYPLNSPTEKDFFVAFFLTHASGNKYDPASRIAPALLFQPHFPNMIYEIHNTEDGKRGVLFSRQYEEIRKSPLFTGFKYVKTFTPMRRITTSYAASTRFTYLTAEKNNAEKKEGERGEVILDVLGIRILNRSFMVDVWDRLYRDSILVRFEDGKLNPKATFTALAEFLDIPYTESMTYCSNYQGICEDGFRLTQVYSTYDDFADDADRALLEYCMRDAYQFYGYDLHYYCGEPVDDDWIAEKASGAVHLDGLVKEVYEQVIGKAFLEELEKQGPEQNAPLHKEAVKAKAASEAQMKVEEYHASRVKVVKAMQRVVFFVNRQGQPLQMMKPLKLDPALLEQPLYR
ncbi:hypothetical protein [Pseudoflavonifractor phocaeensis]|uniref:hypothetical protein n=1 Tax=Pseudoflavonifractor phocaeensis TaxID=1870988 RepID=UPI001957291C|nr:hypothetical protein [Pseudoflavonifractor phocaeensis]MBM6723637.1 hypothetical protein [Pseudoflavonifractor phocaeensis]